MTKDFQHMFQQINQFTSNFFFFSLKNVNIRKGETVYCRAVVLNALTNKPVSSEFINYLAYGVTVKVLGPVSKKLKKKKKFIQKIKTGWR